VQAACILLFAIPAFYWLLQTLGVPLPYVAFTRLHVLILLAGELLIAVFLFPRYAPGPWNARQVGRLGRDFLIANAVFLFPFIKFYTNPLRQEIPLIHQAWPYLLAAYLGLLLVIAGLLFTLGDLQRLSAWVTERIDAQRSRDAEAEATRQAEFAEKYPRLARLPLLGAIGRGVYREGAGYILVLVAIAALGLALRLWKLGALPPYIDEFNHLNAARDLLEGMPFSELQYLRSLYTVTLPAWLSFEVLGQSLFAARLPGVLANILALVPLYLLARRVNKPTALLAAAMFSFSPWVIAASRNLREYACYPLVFYTVGLVMVKLYEALPEQVDLRRDFRSLFSRRNLAYVGLLLFVLIYAVYIDPYSTLKMILILYLAFGLLLARKIDWRRPTNQVAGAFVLGAFILLTLVIVQFTGSQFFLANFAGRDYAFFPSLFFEKPAQQWYFNRPLVSLAIFALALLATSLLDRRKMVLPLSLLTFLGGLFTITFLFLKGDRPRYAMNIEIWFILLMAAGLFAALALGEKFVGRCCNGVPIFGTTYRWVAWAVILLLFWNIPQTLPAGLHTQPGWHPVTKEYHADLAPALAYFATHASPQDAIITTDYVNPYQQYYFPDLFSGHTRLRYNPIDPAAVEKIYAAIDAYPSGWIIFDYPRGYDWSRPLELRDFEHNGKLVKYLGWFGDAYVFKWGD
jgi:hypothetical protein